MLDSSLIELPPIPRPLKRSASVASLPTPPRTHHKRKHARSRSRSRGSDSDELDAARSATATDSDDSDNDSDGSLKGHKKRKLSKTEAENEEEEEAFWTGAEPKSKSVKTSSLSPAPILYRQRHTAPVSPPPSTRKAAPVVEVVPPAVEKESSIVAAPRRLSPPVTPKPSTSRVKAKANPAPLLRDSPGNPFLDSPFAGVDDDTDNDDVLTANGAITSPRTPPRERPTLTYVLYVSPSLSLHTLHPNVLLAVAFVLNLLIHFTTIRSLRLPFSPLLTPSSHRTLHALRDSCSRQRIAGANDSLPRNIVLVLALCAVRSRHRLQALLTVETRRRIRARRKTTTKTRSRTVARARPRTKLDPKSEAKAKARSQPHP